MLLSHMLEFCLTMLLGTLVILKLSLILLLLYDPTKPPFLGYLIPDVQFTLPVRVIVCAYHVSGIWLLCHGLTFASTLVIVYNFFVPYILGKELRVGRVKKCYQASEFIRIPSHIRTVFRSFQLLHANFICLAGLFLVLANAGCMSTAIYIIFVLINYGSNLGIVTKVPFIIASVLIMIVWSGILEIGKFYHIRCKKVFSSWKRYDWGSAKENKIMAKFRLSCRPIVLSYGKNFVIGPLSVLNFSKGVVRGTMRVLLSTKH